MVTLGRVAYICALVLAIPLWALIACGVLIRDALLGPRESDAEWRKFCSRCQKVIYWYTGTAPICTACQTPEERDAWVQAMERAWRIQCYEEHVMIHGRPHDAKMAQDHHRA